MLLATTAAVALLCIPAQAEPTFLFVPLDAPEATIGSAGEASDPTTIFARDLAELLEGDVRLVMPRDMPRIHDMDALTYMASCPPGRELGCATVLGQAGGATWTVLASFERRFDASRMTISFSPVQDPWLQPYTVVRDVPGEDIAPVVGFVAQLMFDLETRKLARGDDIRDLQWESGRLVTDDELHDLVAMADDEEFELSIPELPKERRRRARRQ